MRYSVSNDKVVDMLRSIDAKVTTGFTLTGDAEVTDVIEGKTFYKDEAYTELTGTMTDKSGDPVACSSSAVSGTTLKLMVPAGYYDGSTYVTLTDADFVATNILSGVNIFGLAGSHS